MSTVDRYTAETLGQKLYEALDPSRIPWLQRDVGVRRAWVRKVERLLAESRMQREMAEPA